MKKLTTFALGLALALGTVALAQEAKKPVTPKAADTAAAAPAPVAKKKHRKAHKPAEPKTGIATPNSTPKPATK